MIIKVCGLRDPGNIRKVAAIPGIDLAGLIFYSKSPRFADNGETAEAVSKITGPRVTGVFVNESPDIIVGKCESFNLKCIQLHGSESPEYIIRLRQTIPTGVIIIKAFAVKSAEDMQLLPDYSGLCDYFLFDSPAPVYGGSGNSFDWQLLQSYQGNTPFFLSGGIGPQSLELLKKFSHPLWAGVDLNSKFEISPAIKDVSLLSDFIQKVKLL